MNHRTIYALSISGSRWAQAKQHEKLFQLDDAMLLGAGSVDHSQIIHDTCDQHQAHPL